MSPTDEAALETHEWLADCNTGIQLQCICAIATQ